MMLPAFCFNFLYLLGKSCNVSASTEVSLDMPSRANPTEETGLPPSSSFRVPTFVVGVAVSALLTAFCGGRTFSYCVSDADLKV